MAFKDDRGTRRSTGKLMKQHHAIILLYVLSLIQGSRGAFLLRLYVEVDNLIKASIIGDDEKEMKLSMIILHQHT